jgi:methyl-accepting chemotaxis protein
MAEQTAAGDQMSRSAEGLRRLVGSVTMAMSEQATAMSQIAAATDSMRSQADQTSRGVTEQARAMKDMTAAARNTAKQIKLITQANKDNAAVSGSLLTALGEIRQITERNVSGVKRTRGGTEDLLLRANELTALVDRAGRRRANGRGQRSNGA